MDFLLKQRLVGAIVLVALGVIFIPMLLEGDRTLVPEMEALPDLLEPHSSQPLNDFPAADAIPEAPPTEVISTDVPPAETAPAEPPPPPPPAAPKESPAPAPDPAPVEPAAPEKPAHKSPLGNWVVQMGSFSSEKNAVALRDKLRKAGFTTQVEKVRVDSKTHFRVRVGPFIERADADQTRERLNDKFELKGRVLSYP